MVFVNFTYPKLGYNTTDADTTCGRNSVNGIVLNYRLQDRLDHTLGLVRAAQSSQVILDSTVKQGKPPLVTCGLFLITSANPKYVSRHDVLYLTT